MLNSAKARALAAVLVAGVAAAVGGVAVSHGGGSGSAASAAGAAGVSGGRPGGPGGGFGFRSDLTAAASYLGLTTSRLQARLRNGDTLAAIAKTQGRSKQGLINALVAAETKSLTSAEKAQSLAMIESRVTRLVSSSGPPSGAPPGAPPA